MSDIAKERDLPYFHGAILDEDANRLLLQNGDFLLKTKYEPNKRHNKLMLAVKYGNNKTVHLHVNRVDGGGYRLLGQTFPDIPHLISYYKEHRMDLGRGEYLILIRPIKKGKFQLNHSDIKVLKKIGCGAYGTVYKGILLRDMTTVAIKRIDCTDKSEQGLIDLMKEARVMQLYDHINVVKFYGFIVDREPFLLVMEYCKDGSVEDKLRAYGKRVGIGTRVDMACQIARGLEYLHSKMCIHRDIATRNCLLNGTVVKLADFGMCRATMVYKIDLSKPQNVRWLAPEVWRTGETRFCTDIYAFAITLWELFEIPYNHPYSAWKAYKVKEKVMSGYRMPSPDAMPEAIVTLMHQCWDQNAVRRPTATQAREYLEKIVTNFNIEDDDENTAKPQETSSVSSPTFDKLQATDLVSNEFKKSTPKPSIPSPTTSTPKTPKSPKSPKSPSKKLAPSSFRKHAKALTENKDRRLSY